MVEVLPIELSYIADTMGVELLSCYRRRFVVCVIECHSSACVCGDDDVIFATNKIKVLFN
jgi:hypothetical protein